MKYKIGVFGSAENNKDDVLKKAYQTGETLSKYNVIIITGATTGVSDQAVIVAHKNGAEIWGFPPATSLEELKVLNPDLNFSLYTRLTYIPKNYAFRASDDVCRKYRNVTSTANCDAGIIISGRWGTLNEFTNLYDMGKVIGVLTETGGIADELPLLFKKIHKKSNAKVIFNSNPKKLVEEVLALLEAKMNPSNTSV